MCSFARHVDKLHKIQRRSGSLTHQDSTCNLCDSKRRTLAVFCLEKGYLTQRLAARALARSHSHANLSFKGPTCKHDRRLQRLIGQCIVVENTLPHFLDSQPRTRGFRPVFQRGRRETSLLVIADPDMRWVLPILRVNGIGLPFLANSIIAWRGWEMRFAPQRGRSESLRDHPSFLARP
jgi:hypothetical protein